MTHHADSELLNTLLQLITDEGTDGLVEGLRLLVNQAMLVERSQTLQARPYQRTETRQGYANGYKDKTFTTRLGPIGCIWTLSLIGSPKLVPVAVTAGLIESAEIAKALSGPELSTPFEAALLLAAG
jgi:Transposase, Mutator family